MVKFFNTLINNLDLYISGMGTTLLLTLFSIIGGTVLGILIALLRRSRFRAVRIFPYLYVEILRGTPMLLQICIWVFAINIPDIIFLGHGSGKFIAGLIAISTNSGAYVSEIMRAGIQAVDIGQTEAARSLGMSSSLSMRLIVLPQAIRNILPALGNEFVVLIKDSSLVAGVGIAELMFQANRIVNMTYNPWAGYIGAAIFYLIMTVSMSNLVAFLERRLNFNLDKSFRKKSKSAGEPLRRPRGW